ncbi:hypothetical protein [Marinomonas epiphytica]
MLKKAFLTGICVVSMSVGSSALLAFEDYCTPKLESHIQTLQKTVDSKYMPSSQKKTAQAILDKVNASRNEKGDCVLVDELF